MHVRMNLLMYYINYLKIVVRANDLHDVMLLVWEI